MCFAGAKLSYSKMMTGNGELYLAQEDGGLPTTLAAGSARGESGVSVHSMRFLGGAHFSVTTRQHLVGLQMSPRARFDCRIAGRALRHESPAGRWPSVLPEATAPPMPKEASMPFSSRSIPGTSRSRPPRTRRWKRS